MTLLTVLVVVVAAEDRQAFPDGRPHHKRVGRALAVLVGLCQRELLEVESQLTHVGLLVDGHLTRVGPVVCSWIQIVHEDGLVLFGPTAARELEVAARGEPGRARAVGSAGAREAVVLRETRARSAGVGVTGRVLVANDGEDGRDGRRPE